jgi:hypothetical protein
MSSYVKNRVVRQIDDASRGNSGEARSAWQASCVAVLPGSIPEPCPALGVGVEAGRAQHELFVTHANLRIVRTTHDQPAACHASRTVFRHGSPLNAHRPSLANARAGRGRQGSTSHKLAPWPRSPFPRLISPTSTCARSPWASPPPEAECERESRHATFRVRKKVFAYFLDNHHGDGMVAACVRGDVRTHAHLIKSEPKRFFLPTYIGPRGYLGNQPCRLEGGRRAGARELPGGGAEAAPLIHQNRAAEATVLQYWP